MKLVKLKLANSLNYGDMVMLAHYNIQKMGTNKISYQKNMTRTKGTTIAIVGTEEIISEYSKYLTNSSLKIIDKNFIKDEQVINWIYSLFKCYCNKYIMIKIFINIDKFILLLLINRLN